MPTVPRTQRTGSKLCYAARTTGPVQRTETLLVMGHDAAAGQLKLKDDRLRAEWPNAAADPSYAGANSLMRQVSDANGADF